jgi:SAM-dependent methyltransferase
VRVQAGVHVAVLLLAALALPLRASGVLGDPPAETPTLWLLGVLAVSLGAPFAALSATAPLLQAWWAAARGERANPYVLYAASNIGSLVALLGYPLLVEPLLALDAQRAAWTGGYALFVAAAALVGLTLPAARRQLVGSAARPALAQRWRQRAWWALLGAIPSSLLLGVTAHITADVASAPFLWIVPLALYLLTFVLVFQDRPVIPPSAVLLLQALIVPICLALTPVNVPWWAQLPLHLGTFFLTALMCHGRLAESRPEPGRLTEFYLAMSVGGVLGGAFNALVAPVLFDAVWEYPLALVAAALVRPWARSRPSRIDLALFTLGLAAAAVVAFAPGVLEFSWPKRIALLTVATMATLLRGRIAAHAVLLAAVAIVGVLGIRDAEPIASDRSFFGVYRVSERTVPGLGQLRTLTNGTTLHGAQALDPARRCRPLTYYAPTTPIGQAVAAVQARGPVRIGVVGLGAGSLAGYVQPGDSLRFYEIDPLVVSLAREQFSYLDGCAKGPVDVVVGDARLTVAREPAGGYDLLVLDAFSSDAVPTHLMTAEAMRVWLRALKPDGLIAFHVSNRNLELEAPVAATLRAEGATVAAQLAFAPKGQPRIAALTSQVVVASPSAAAIARLRQDPRWRDARIEASAPGPTTAPTFSARCCETPVARPASPRPRSPAPPALPRGR